VLLGFIGTESGVPVNGEEDVVIYNLTGPVWGCSTAAGTPICTAVTFDNVILTVNGTALSVGDVAPGTSETFGLPDGIFADGSITSLSLSATLSTELLTDDLGNTYQVLPGLALTGLATDGSLPAIPAALALTSVPEPANHGLLLLVCLAAGAVSLRGRRSLS